MLLTKEVEGNTTTLPDEINAEALEVAVTVGVLFKEVEGFLIAEDARALVRVYGTEFRS